VRPLPPDPAQIDAVKAQLVGLVTAGLRARAPAAG
jgi:hypothetical protein